MLRKAVRRVQGLTAAYGVVRPSPRVGQQHIAKTVGWRQQPAEGWSSNRKSSMKDTLLGVKWKHKGIFWFCWGCFCLFGFVCWRKGLCSKSRCSRNSRSERRPNATELKYSGSWSWYCKTAHNYCCGWERHSQRVRFQAAKLAFSKISILQLLCL